MMSRTIHLLVLLMFIALVPTGCSHPEGARRMARREAGIRADFDRIAEFEARRPAAVERDLSLIPRTLQRDADNFGPAAERYGEFWTRDFERYEQRKREYHDIAVKLLTGKPEVALDPLILLY
jgi:hypothetical protein